MRQTSGPLTERAQPSLQSRQCWRGHLKGPGANLGHCGHARPLAEHSGGELALPLGQVQGNSTQNKPLLSPPCLPVPITPRRSQCCPTG